MAVRKENIQEYKEYKIDLQDFTDWGKGWSFKISGPDREIAQCYWCKRLYFDTEELATEAYKKIIDERSNTRS